MARITLELPSQFDFSTTIPVRITDLNYGGHVGNDTILTLIHEARMQFLRHHGYSESNIGGKAMIMGDVAIIFKNELFYGESVRVSIAVTNIERVSFELFYLLEKDTAVKTLVVAQAKTGMVCFDYEKRKVSSLPDEVKAKFLTGV
jgi:acyl-CoA thioester hydrolase